MLFKDSLFDNGVTDEQTEKQKNRRQYYYPQLSNENWRNPKLKSIEPPLNIIITIFKWVGINWLEDLHVLKYFRHKQFTQTRV